MHASVAVDVHFMLLLLSDSSLYVDDGQDT